jgi:hypothetical protein
MGRAIYRQSTTVSPESLVINHLFLPIHGDKPMKSLINKLFAGAFAVGVGSLVSCSSGDDSSIMVAITSEAPVPESVKTIQILVESKGEVRYQQTYDTLATDVVRLPGTIAFTRKLDSESNEPISVTITATVFSKNEQGTGITQKHIVRRSTLRFSEGKQKLLRMPIRFACLDFGCPTGQTCAAGACVDSSVEVDDLPDLENEKVSGDNKECFDNTKCVQKNEPASFTFEEFAAANAFNPADCTVTNLTPNTRNVNVGMVWADNPLKKWTVVEYDPIEGWAYKNDDFSKMHLAKGLCDIVKAQATELAKPAAMRDPAKIRINRLVETSGCEPKPPSLPNCPESQ